MYTVSGQTEAQARPIHPMANSKSINQSLIEFFCTCAVLPTKPSSIDSIISDNLIAYLMVEIDPDYFELPDEE
jgi:hypothetical protein